MAPVGVFAMVPVTRVVTPPAGAIGVTFVMIVGPRMAALPGPLAFAVASLGRPVVRIASLCVPVAITGLLCVAPLFAGLLRMQLCSLALRP